jgi:23S rRNA pseudouridine1911/1915/1917 synthase
MKHNKEPPFDLPVIYQDDHIAVVNKPEGVVVFGHKNGGYGRHTVKSALPYVLKPPKLGTLSVMWNPMPVHRLDRATSGLLVVAKTKAALVHLSNQFKERRIKKTCK